MTDPWALPRASPAFGGPPGSGERFPLGAEAGWRPDPNVPNLLRLWDSRHWTEHTRPLDPAAEAIAQAPPIRDNSGVRAWALISQLTLGLWITVSCVAMLWQIATLNTLSIWQLQPGDGHDTEARRILTTMLLILGAQGLVWVVSIVFFVWMGVTRHDRYLNPRVLRGSMAGTVIGWWIPFLRIRVTWRALTDVLQASDPTRGGRPLSRSRAAPPLVVAFVLLRFFPSWIGLLLINQTRAALGSVDQLRDVMLAGILGTAVLVATDNLRGGRPPWQGTAKPFGAQFTRV